MAPAWRASAAGFRPTDAGDDDPVVPWAGALQPPAPRLRAARASRLWWEGAEAAWRGADPGRRPKRHALHADRVGALGMPADALRQRAGQPQERLIFDLSRPILHSWGAVCPETDLCYRDEEHSTYGEPT